MDRIVTLKEKVTTTDDFGEEIITWIDLVKAGTELATGTLTIGTLYQITATETDHFYEGCAMYETFTASAETELNAENKVKPVTLSSQVWAERLELRGSERWQSLQVISKVACKYRIRYRDDVGPMDMLIDGDREYDIHAALELGRREGKELLVAARGET
jgi:head-tail adaptor